MHKVIRLLLAFSFLVYYQYSHSQNYRDMFYERMNRSNDLAFSYCDSLLTSTEPNIKAFAYGGKGHILSKKGDYSDAEKLFELAESTLINIKNNRIQKEERLYLLNFYCLNLIAQHDLEKANKILNEGLILSKQLEDKEMQIKMENLLGRCYSLLGLSAEAIEVAKNTIRNLLNSKASLDTNFYNQNLLSAYLNTGSRFYNFFLLGSTKNKAYLDSCHHYISKAQTFVEKNNFTPSLEQNLQVLGLQASSFFHKKEFKKAIPLFERLIKTTELHNLKKVSYQTKFRLAESYFFLEEYDKAKAIFDSLKQEDLEAYNLLKNGVVINYYYAQINAKAGNVEKALEYTELYNSRLESFYKNKSDLTIDVFTSNELNEKKAILEELDYSQNKVRFLNTYLILAGLLLVIGIPIIIIYIKVQKKRLQVKINNLSKHLENIEQKKSNTAVLKIDEDKAKDILDKIKKIEEEELFKLPNYSLNMLAKKVNTNSTYVSKVINKYWSKTFVEYTNQLRIDYILIKLNHDELYKKFTLKAIAESVGYKSLNSFNKHFKQITGITPKQYLDYQLKKAKK